VEELEGRAREGEKGRRPTSKARGSGWEKMEG